MKQAIILRTDLKMEKGKMVAQGAHAAVECAEKVRKADKELFEQWINEGMKKIALKVDSEDELVKIFEKAKRKTRACLIRDAGKTQIPSGSKTAVGIGPDKDEVIDEIIKELKLL